MCSYNITDLIWPFNLMVQHRINQVFPQHQLPLSGMDYYFVLKKPKILGVIPRYTNLQPKHLQFYKTTKTSRGRKRICQNIGPLKDISSGGK